MIRIFIFYTYFMEYMYNGSMTLPLSVFFSLVDKELFRLFQPQFWFVFTHFEYSTFFPRSMCVHWKVLKEDVNICRSWACLGAVTGRQLLLNHFQGTITQLSAAKTLCGYEPATRPIFQGLSLVWRTPKSKIEKVPNSENLVILNALGDGHVRFIRSHNYFYFYYYY